MLRRGTPNPQLQQPKVTVLGSANVDLVIRTKRLPKKGETLIGDAFDIFTGGKGFNQATAAARLGAKVTFIGRIGDDPYAEVLRSAMEAEKMDTQHVKTDAESGTGIATIIVQPDGDNSIIVVPRANMQITPADIDEAENSIANAEVLMLQLETPIDASERAAEIAKANDTIVILDPAPARQIPLSLLSKVDILKPNRTEASLLSGCSVTSPETAIAAAKAITNTDSKRWNFSSRANTWTTRINLMHTNTNIPRSSYKNEGSGYNGCRRCVLWCPRDISC